MSVAQSLQSWADGLTVAENAMGEEELLDGNGRVVSSSSDFERREFQKSIGELLLHSGCCVLEVGFGLGVCAEIIQQANPKAHAIVECAPAALQRLREWARDRPSVVVVEGTWQRRLPDLGSFDRVFFDASSDLDLNIQEIRECSDAHHRALYLQALEHEGPEVFDAFEAAIAALHSNPGARVISSDGSEFRQWADGFFFSRDSQGKEQLLDADGAQIMMQWEQSYMEECVKELCIDETCDVLEVGFGCGYSANRIQQMRPRSHTIVECAEVVLERLRVWAADKPNVRVVQGTWQARMPDLGVFDCIFFDDYGMPGIADREMKSCPRSEYRKEYDETFEHDGGSHFEAFVRIALAWHARKGARLSGFMMHMVGDLGDAGIDSNYRFIEVSPPPHCNYFFSRRAIVPLFTKRSSGVQPADDCGSSTRLSSISPNATEAGSESDDGSRSCSRNRSRSRNKGCRQTSGEM